MSKLWEMRKRLHLRTIRPTLGGMNAKQYREAIEQLGLTQVAAGQLFFVNERTSRRWALGGAPVPPLVAMLLNLMISKKYEMEVDVPEQRSRRVWTLQAKQAVHAI